MISYNLIFILLTLCSFPIRGDENQSSKVDSKVINLLPGISISLSSNQDKLHIFCFKAKNKTLEDIFTVASIQISGPGSDRYTKFEGTTPKEVEENFDKYQALWSFSMLLPFKQKEEVHMNPFQDACLGIVSPKTYDVILTFPYVEMKFLQFCLGFVLYVISKKCSHSTLFYYIAGVILGICTSTLVVLYFFSRFVNSKFRGWFIGGSVLFAYFFQIHYLWNNLKVLLFEHSNYFIGYFVLSGAISFIVCYRFGPPSNPRTKKIIEWLFKVIGVSLIVTSSHLWELLIPIILFLLGWSVNPKTREKITTKIKKLLFRPKIKLLTKKEYVEQGRIETQKALEELRGYCSSPDCNQWKTVLKLKNPLRFAEFMEGSFHVSDDEVDEYESLCIKPNGTIITDDSESVTEYTEED